jgi:hypothetical protein
MTTQYKRLPSDPTEEMLKAVDYFMNPVAKALYEIMWQAAPVCIQSSAKTTWKDGDTSYTCEFTGSPHILPSLYANSQMCQGTTQAVWVRFDPDDETTWPPLDSGSGIHSIRVITNGGDICEFIHTSKQWIYLLNYEIDQVTHWARLPVYKGDYYDLG